MMDGKKGGLSGIYDDFWGNQEKNNSIPEEPHEEDDGEVQRIAREVRRQAQQDFDVKRPSAQKSEKRIKEAEKLTKEPEEPSKETSGEQEEPQQDPMEQLQELVGLTELKEDVKELVSLVKVQKLRQENGLKTVPVSLHLVFSGNPGTGKTTIARILAKLYQQIGVLSKGQLVEVDRSALVAGYVGQTAMKTQEKIKEAMGGILFIDEAYTLVREGGNDFGQEAIDTILKAMEDHRDELVVIVAGYPDLMKRFVNSNPGLKSRFNKFFYFPDYTVEELMEIFRGFCRKYDYQMEEETEAEVTAHIHKMEEEKDENFANARSVRNFFEKIITNQAARIAAMEQPKGEDMKQIRKEDLE